MSPKPLIILAAIASCGVLYYAFQSAAPAPTQEAQAPKKAPTSAATAEVKPLASQPPAPEERPVAQASASLPAALGPMDATTKERVFEEIHQASITYSPADLPRIQPYLAHPDPEIREAALNGVVVLGDAKGAALLREAALKLTNNPKEMAALLEKADWLELPSPTPEMMLKRIAQMKARKAAQNAAKNGSPPGTTATPGANATPAPK